MTVTTSARITALDAISGATVASADVFVMVDTSDATMASTGTDFKIRSDELSSAMTFMPSYGRGIRDVMGLALQSTSTITVTYTASSGIETAAIGIDVYSIVQAVDNVTSTNYTLVLSDAGHLKLLNTAAASVFRLPLNASVAFPIGTHIDFAQTNVGQYTVTTQAGVTNISNPATPKTTTSAMGSVIKTATDTWITGGYVV